MAAEAYEIRSGLKDQLRDRLRGRVTCFDGVDGAGKTTMMKWLASELRAGVEDESDIVIVREPGGTQIGEAIRNLLLHGRRSTDETPYQMHAMTETLMFFASRAELYDAVILPAISANKIVLSDRCLYSTIAYQCFGLAPRRNYHFPMQGVLDIAELVLPKISRCNELPCSRPSFTMILDIPGHVRDARKGALTQPDTIEARGADFLDRVREGFLEVGRMVPNVEVIPAEGSIPEVQSLIASSLARFYQCASTR